MDQIKSTLEKFESNNEKHALILKIKLEFNSKLPLLYLKAVRGVFHLKQSGET